MMKNYFFTTMFAATFAIVLLCACSPQAAIILNSDNSATISYTMDSGKVIQNVLQGIGIIQADKPLFDAGAIRSALTQAGLTVTAISFSTPTSLNVTAICPDIQKLLPAEDTFIHVTKTATHNSLKLTINPQTVQQAATLLSADTADLLDLLIAPVFTGETMTAAEYTDLIAISYGASSAAELKTARLRLAITVPATIKTASASNKNAATASFTGNTAVFTFNLVSLLTDLRTTDYEIRW